MLRGTLTVADCTRFLRCAAFRAVLLSGSVRRTIQAWSRSNPCDQAVHTPVARLDAESSTHSDLRSSSVHSQSRCTADSECMTERSPQACKMLDRASRADVSDDDRSLNFSSNKPDLMLNIEVDQQIRLLHCLLIAQTWVPQHTIQQRVGECGDGSPQTRYIAPWHPQCRSPMVLFHSTCAQQALNTRRTSRI
jgi:hypothetical protein